MFQCMAWSEIYTIINTTSVGNGKVSVSDGSGRGSSDRDWRAGAARATERPPLGAF